jgi:hypothetical protein
MCNVADDGDDSEGGSDEDEDDEEMGDEGDDDAIDDAMAAGLGSGALRWKDNLVEKARERFVQGRAQNLMHLVYGKGPQETAEADDGEQGVYGTIYSCAYVHLVHGKRFLEFEETSANFNPSTNDCTLDSDDEFFKVRKPKTADTGIDELETSRFVVGETDLRDWSSVDVCHWWLSSVDECHRWFSNVDACHWWLPKGGRVSLAVTEVAANCSRVFLDKNH